MHWYNHNASSKLLKCEEKVMYVDWYMIYLIFSILWLRPENCLQQIFIMEIVRKMESVTALCIVSGVLSTRIFWCGIHTYLYTEGSSWNDIVLWNSKHISVDSYGHALSLDQWYWIIIRPSGRLEQSEHDLFNVRT